MSSTCNSSFKLKINDFILRDGTDEPPFKDSSVEYGENVTFCKSRSLIDPFICVIPTQLVPMKRLLCTESEYVVSFSMSSPFCQISFARSALWTVPSNQTVGARGSKDRIKVEFYATFMGSNFKFTHWKVKSIKALSTGNSIRSLCVVDGRKILLLQLLLELEISAFCK